MSYHGKWKAFSVHQLLFFFPAYYGQLKLMLGRYKVVEVLLDSLLPNIHVTMKRYDSMSWPREKEQAGYC